MGLTRLPHRRAGKFPPANLAFPVSKALRLDRTKNGKRLVATIRHDKTMQFVPRG